MKAKEREERSEYVGLYTTPSMAKKIRESNDNDVLKDKIIKDYITNETDWLKSEMQDMDDITTIYRAKLLTIKENFSKAQYIYIKEIEDLMSKSDEALKPINGKFLGIEKRIETMKNGISYASDMIRELSSKIGYIDYSRIERLLDAIDRFNKMDESEKELIKLVLNK